MSQRPPSFDLATVRWIALGSMVLGASSTLLLGWRFAPRSEIREGSAKATLSKAILSSKGEMPSPRREIDPQAFRVATPQFKLEDTPSERTVPFWHPPAPRDVALSEEPSSPPTTGDRTPVSNSHSSDFPVSPTTSKSGAIAENADSSSDDSDAETAPPPTAPSPTAPPEPLETWSLPEVRGERLELELSEAVVLALQNNRDIENAYLERLLSLRELASAEDKFVPDFTPEVTIAADRNWLEESSTNRDALRLNARVEVRLPTGASIEASIGSSSDPGFDATGNDFFQVDTVNQDVQVQFVQPLLQGAGTTVNRASIDIVRLEDRSAYLALKATLMDTITQAIGAYRRLLQAQESLEIQQFALENARTQVEVTQALIEGGRLAPIELVTSQTQVANREVSVVEAQNALGQAQLDLLQVLDLDREAIPTAVESPSIPEFDRDRLQLDRLVAVALQSNPEYLQLLLQLERTQLNLLLAEDARRWQLDFDARYRQGLEGFRDTNGEWRAALVLRRAFFGDDRLDVAVARQETAVQTLKNRIDNVKEDLSIDLRDAVRDLEAKFRQVELAQRARELAQEQLENEREKLRLGVGNIRLLDLVTLENELVSAENRELNAAIAYLNAQTALERLLGVTLERWDLDIEIEAAEDASDVRED
ncbi:TolC family protein [Baaleninema simplex]|uniref:TolC family protein n=1 Tax=Baaleninema simplex TaxID=2862350 RepID=UPI00034B1F73|nr:TolC family protein [Baaleninema simplex]